jgi:hypothetical protein
LRCGLCGTGQDHGAFSHVLFGRLAAELHAAAEVQRPTGVLVVGHVGETPANAGRFDILSAFDPDQVAVAPPLPKVADRVGFAVDDVDQRQAQSQPGEVFHPPGQLVEPRAGGLGRGGAGRVEAVGCGHILANRGQGLAGAVADEEGALELVAVVAPVAELFAVGLAGVPAVVEVGPVVHHQRVGVAGLRDGRARLLEQRLDQGLQGHVLVLVEPPRRLGAGEARPSPGQRAQSGGHPPAHMRVLSHELLVAPSQARFQRGPRHSIHPNPASFLPTCVDTNGVSRGLLSFPPPVLGSASARFDDTP